MLARCRSTRCSTTSKPHSQPRLLPPTCTRQGQASTSPCLRLWPSSSGCLSSLLAHWPPAPSPLPLNTGVPDGTEVLITSTQTITAFTIALNGAAAIFGNVSTLTAGAAVRYRYYLATNSWYNIVNDFFFNPVIIGTSLVLSGSASIGTTLSVTGLSTLVGGAVIQGMTVGKGLAAVATNTALGFDVLAYNTTGNSNVGAGYQALFLNENWRI